MLKCVFSPYKNKEQDLLGEFSPDKIMQVKNYHATFPQYKVTPLHCQQALANFLGVKAVYVKDESYRFALNAFKVLGASYAIAKYIASSQGLPEEQLSYANLIAANPPPTTFTTTTDGNHGRGVAWTANLLEQKAIVNMPKGTVAQRVKAIEQFGAQVNVTEFNYDDTVRLTARQAQEHNSVIIQDTAWPGYEEIPLWIMKGYATMACEAKEQLPENPTHVFVQAGVGSMAAAVVAAFVNFYQTHKPFFALLEAKQAACFYETACNALPRPLAVTGELETIMAGLACGEASSLAWPILRNYVDAYFALENNIAACGMRVLANPIGKDPKVVSGESGAVGMGLLYALMLDKHKKIRQKAGLDENSVVLLFSTEGATDEENYLDIVWRGKYPYL